MHVGYTPEQEKLRQELRAYFAALMTPDLRAALTDDDGEYGDGEAYRAVVRRLGHDGWLALGWPVEHGGRGRSRLDQLIFADEAAMAGVPVPFLTIDTVGPTIARHGSGQQRAELLPRIAAGEVHFSIGYSEPEAGTDLAALRTRAVRDGDHYVINGQKMWTSLIRYADYVWLACRTDPSAERHRGLSILVVPTDAPGFSWTPVRTVAGPTTSATYYADVRVPVSARVGAENEGWRLITDQLNHERVALTLAAPLRRALDEVTAWAVETGAVEREWVRLHLARVHAKTEVLKLLNWRVAASADADARVAAGPASGAGAAGADADGGAAPGPASRGRPAFGTDGLSAAVRASAGKVYGTELAVEAYRLLMEVLGPAATVRAGSPGALLHGRIERMHRASLILTFGGGANEVQRDIIAAGALGLPVKR
ncbi:acyl-CoA dehydrogenase family protein [Actinoplanes awajinensis]|uniref:Acyl-CoA dehydrogenase n=1 Tax=Actinoplanes awajinensis subsp. mycoplanecinus TaxID=135947 RepID=A0A0X3V9R5_9ACTN|nr:acyl-CoA dehydrogenase family protein [Actinoplanes awajinensis]KUL41438.1 acyl-CoA dehydrogenase [Actinoplanes awajinensis subsp. mycoplanecinus]